MAKIADVGVECFICKRFVKSEDVDEKMRRMSIESTSIEDTWVYGCKECLDALKVHGTITAVADNGKTIIDHRVMVLKISKSTKYCTHVQLPVKFSKDHKTAVVILL